MNRVLVITTEPLPLPGGLTTGAGLRAWGLAEGLRSQNLEVIIATPLEGDQATEQSMRPSDQRKVCFFQRNNMAELIAAESPHVIVMQHWGLVYALPPTLPCPLVIDLAGPHLLERQYWGNPDPDRDMQEKIAALSRADFVTVGGEFQRHYFYPYLALAGFDITHDKFPVIPFSVSPETVNAPPPATGETTFIYGGAFLAWQNPEKSIRWLLDEMDKADRGRLLFYGGSHPSLDASGGRFLDLYLLLKGHPRVEIRGWKAYEELLVEYASEGHVALDLMERNPERELAYTTRTMVYLHCGLPVIYNNYSEISQLISNYGCGWCLSPDDETAFRALVSRLIRHPEEGLQKRKAALACAKAQCWDKTIEPLADFCKNPQYRTRREMPAPMMPLQSPASPTISENDPRPAISSFSQIRRNFFPHPGKWMGIIVYLPVWLVCKYLYYRLKVSNSSRAH